MTPPSATGAPARIFSLDGTTADAERALAAEVPVALSYGDVPFGVMMLTPADLEDFAVGFSLTEGIVAAAADIRAVSVAPDAGGLALRVDLTGARLGAHLARQRALSGRTSCGLCGITDAGQLRRARPPGGPAPPVSLAAIRRALRDLDGRQPLNAATRAVHGAAWAGPDGGLVAVREDVGRHNALDKLAGALLRARDDTAAGFAVITSRASFEMVEKAAAFGARTLVAISAPTALAVERAQALDLTLIGIARADAVTAFVGADRVTA